MQPYDITISSASASMMQVWAKAQADKFDADPTNTEALKTKRAIGEIADLVTHHYALQQKLGVSPSAPIREEKGISDKAPIVNANLPQPATIYKPFKLPE